MTTHETLELAGNLQLIVTSKPTKNGSMEWFGVCVRHGDLMTLKARQRTFFTREAVLVAYLQAPRAAVEVDR